MKAALALPALGAFGVLGVAAQHPQPSQPSQQLPPPATQLPAQPGDDCHAGSNCYGIPCVRVNQDANGHCEPGRGVIPYPPGDPRLGTPVNPTPALPVSPANPQRLI